MQATDLDLIQQYCKANAVQVLVNSFGPNYIMGNYSVEVDFNTAFVFFNEETTAVNSYEQFLQVIEKIAQ